ncbi:MAG: molybdopterin-dependent oxidoreductase [Verrucomicrobia bacterium]|nr:molybdopterin-dependent oxidoreductase [Verrucomicrobiota bacterium]
MAQKLTTCTFCGVGCGMYLETDGKSVKGVYPSMSHPSNLGRICVRGWHIHEVARSPERLKRPLIRKNGKLEEVEWEEALGFIAEKLTKIRDVHGPDALAFLNSPRCSNEESYLLQKFAREVIGTNNVDHGAGVYCNNSLRVLLEMIGVPATTCSIGDIEKSELILVDGVDLARQLPTIGGRVMRAKLGGAGLIVVDSRRHCIAEHADYFLQIKPGTEGVLYDAMAKVLTDRGRVELGFIKAHCENYEEFVHEVRQYDLVAASLECGVPVELIERAALAYGRAAKAVLMYSTGVENRGRNTIRSFVNLALLRGNLGREGAGLFALCEQNNLQGVCDMGMLPDYLPGYRHVSGSGRDAARAGGEVTRPPGSTGLDAHRVLRDRGGGKVRALWLSRYDPVTTSYFYDAERTLDEFEFVVLQHLFPTGSARFADVVLPLVAFGEETVTFTSTDRRVQLANKVKEPPHGQVPSWRQITLVAQKMGESWDYASAEDVMNEVAENVTAYSGIDYRNLEGDYGRQWPCTREKPLGTPTLFSDATAERRFKFFTALEKARRIEVNPEFPLLLIFGHSLYYWNQNVLVRHSETLKREYRILLLDYPKGFVEMSTADAKVVGIKDGAKVMLCTPYGKAQTTARVTGEIKQGSVFLPYFVSEVGKSILGESFSDDRESFHPVLVRIEKLQ